MVGCGDKKPKTADDADTGGTVEPEPAPDPAPASSIRPLEEGGGSSSSNSNKPIDPADDEYELNHRDCDALASAYARSWENDEMVKLDKKNLKPKQHERVAAQIHEGAIEASDNWRSECHKIVGTAMLHSRLSCAAKAKTMQRFNDCWDGKVQE